MNSNSINWVQRFNNEETFLWLEDPNQKIKLHLLLKNFKSFITLFDFEKQPPMVAFSAPKLFSQRMSTRIGIMPKLPKNWLRRLGPFISGASVGGQLGRWEKLSGLVHRVFFPSSQRAQVTALACTLPRDSGRPLSRWSSAELVKTVIDKGIASSISAATIRNWLRAEKIKPWQYHSWQKSTDPRFLERATVVLNLYEQAQELARRKEIIVCADEKTSIQARKLTGGVTAAGPDTPMKVGDRYQRGGALNLFAGLLVHSGETIARCFERKRFVEFQMFLSMVFKSLWCKKIKVLHYIFDNGPTHAPKSIEAWIANLKLPFRVKIHWLPVHASWLDQVEIIFSPLKNKILSPAHFDDKQDLEKVLMHYFNERNKNPKPIRWTYTAAQLQKKFAPKLVPALCA